MDSTTAVTFEEHLWRPQVPRETVSAATWTRISQPYRAAVPARIEGFRFELSDQLLDDVQNAQRQLIGFDLEVGSVTAPFASILLRSESASSSQIENLTSTARAIAEAELGERTDGNAPLIVSNVRAMEAALAASDHLDQDRVIAMHRELMQHSDPDIVGHYRNEQVWIGGGERTNLSPHGADFVPPHHSRVPEAIDDLLAFAARPAALPLAEIAIAHAQFETIHPFPDGNGRTGRALVQAALRRTRLTNSVTVPISAGILQQRERYFEALGAYRMGDIVPIIRVFADGVVLAVANGRQLVDDIETVKAAWSERLTGVRADSVARRIADLALEHPVLNSRLIQDRVQRSARAIFSALDLLTERGVLAPGNSRRRNRIWVARDLTAALDAFAERSRRWP